MIAVLKPEWRPLPKPGAKPKLKLEDRGVVALYWREERTYFHIGSLLGHQRSECLSHCPLG
jgi:hypothetical protein